MTITINGVSYENAVWHDDSADIQTEMTLEQIESALTPGVNALIIISEGPQELARYINKGIDSITVRGGSPRYVTVQFIVTQVSRDAEVELHEEIEDTDGAIVELAEIVSELTDLEELVDVMHNDLVRQEETISTWFTYSTDLANFINDLRKVGGILDTIDARLTALEHEVGIVSVRMNNEEAE